MSPPPPPAPAPTAHPRPAAEPVLRLRGIEKTYRLGAHTVPALRGVDLDLCAGELLALTGPSGSGKSTLLHIAGLVEVQDAGSLQLAGAAAQHLSPQQATLLRRRLIGFVFQSFNLVPVMSAAENVEYPLFIAGMPVRQRRAAVAQMLAAVGLGAHAQHRPDALSGGQRQRVAIARALIKRPALVIADEPTAALDSATAAQMVALMRELGRAQGAAFLIATHDERLLPQCDRIAHLHDGRLMPAAQLQA